MATAAYVVGCRVAQRSLDAPDVTSTFAPTLIPLAFGYTLAHTFASLVTNGQTLLIRASDPYGDGSDWFGTAGWIENNLLVSPTIVSWVAIIGMLVVSAASLMLLRTRAVAAAPDLAAAARAQFPLAITLQLYVAAGLWLLVAS